MHFSLYQHIYKCDIRFIQQCRATQCFILWMNQFMNESSESVIQRSMFRFYWISRFERIEWVSDSTIHVSFLLNQPFWMNRVSQWFNDPCLVSIESAVLNESSESVIQRSMFHFYWISRFEWIEWVSDSMMNTCLVSIESAVLNESSESVIQRSMFRLYWISRFERIEWVSDSTIHVSFLLNQPFWTNRVSQWFNDPCFVSIESAVLNESSESVIQRWTNQFATVISYDLSRIFNKHEHHKL